jgi:hypothetical protein
MNKRNLHIQQLSAENRPDKNPYQWAIRDRSRPEAGDLQVFATARRIWIDKRCDQHRRIVAYSVPN